MASDLSDLSLDAAAGTGTSVPAVPPMPLDAVRIEKVSKVYGHGAGAVPALDGISLEVAAGEFLCMVGASGCGKSTLLNLVAGLDKPTAGTVHAQGRVALMFQEAALFPWLTVQKNVELPLRLRGVGKKERKERAARLLETVHLAGFADKRPFELSGGMRQRVAIARAFAQDADVLLMDEPFGALDAMTRDLLHAELERLWADRNLSVVFVTHNVREAARLADRVVLLSSRPGRVVLLSSRPGRVVNEFTVEIDRPRRMDSPEVSSLAADITDELRTEVRRHAR